MDAGNLPKGRRRMMMMMMQAIAENFKKGLPWKLLYADDLVLMAESKAELEKRLLEWIMRLREGS